MTSLSWAVDAVKGREVCKARERKTDYGIFTFCRFEVSILDLMI
jgi:hypothetical protein